MSLPRCLTQDFFSQVADSISKSGDQFFQDVHESSTAIKVLCIQQSCVAENKYLVEVLDGSVPVQYKHTCLALVPPTADGDKQLVGKVISFNQYKITPTKSRYLIILTRIVILPGDYRHLTCHLGPALVYNPGFSIEPKPSNPPTAVVPSTHVDPAGPKRPSDDFAAPLKKSTGPYGAAAAPQPSKPIVKAPETGCPTPIRISDLTLYSPKWLIRARVSYKSQIKKFSNQWGEGQMFTIDLCDANGEIRATLFGEAVTKWYNFIEEGQVYSISGGQLKPANKKFNTLRHSCEISLDENCQIQLYQNDHSIPAICCNIIPLKDLDKVEVGSVVDVVGIVARVKDTKQIQSKGSGSSTEKRDILLCDQSATPTWLTLWGAKSQMFPGRELENNPLICFKGVKVNEWQGKKLDTTPSTKITLDPVIAEAAEVRRWWSTTGCNMSFDGGRTTAETNIEELFPVRHILNAANQALQFKSLGDSGITFTTRAMVEVIKESTFSWPACSECHRKMSNDTGYWCCTRCQSKNHPRHTYILTMKITDATGHLWASAMSGVAEEIMNKVPAGELISLLEGGELNADGKNFMNVFEEARLSEYIFKIKVTSEKYMDEVRLKYRVMKAMRLSRNMDLAISLRIRSIKEIE
ncbi:replication factor-A protein 1 [Babesia gibsoni]|uniref:Replication protein A subunit n=1 Tax=Babesia gibsoni TaxID=33632 RepID=A0AAD8PES7_BABGI|nr:replication factor-A protein 1 [Babesia gibsoni]